MRCPSEIPAGTSTASLRRPVTRPRPRQSRQGSVGTRPSPWQTSQAIVRTICPNGVRVVACSCPLPPQRSHVSIAFPARLHAVAMLAAVNRLVGNLHLHAVGRFNQIYLDCHRDVGTRSRPGTTGRATPKKASNRSQSTRNPSKLGAYPPI